MCFSLPGELLDPDPDAPDEEDLNCPGWCIQEGLASVPNNVHDVDSRRLCSWTRQMPSGVNLHRRNVFKGLKMFFVENNYQILQH